MAERYTFEEIYEMDNGIVTFDNYILRLKVASALSKVPCEVADEVMDECLVFSTYYLSNSVEPSCVYLSALSLMGKSLIVLSEKLFEQPKEVIDRTILHEIAHHCLPHSAMPGEGLSVEQHEKLEKEAWELVESWLAEEDHLCNP